MESVEIVMEVVKGWRTLAVKETRLESFQTRKFKAARALLGWQFNETARRCGVSRSALYDFEIGKKDINFAVCQTIMACYHNAGIRFRDNGVTLGVHGESADEMMEEYMSSFDVKKSGGKNHDKEKS